MKPSNIKKNLQKRLRNNVEAAIYSRGLNYFNSGCVENIYFSVNKKNYSEKIRGILIEGDVKENKVYRSKIVYDFFKNEFFSSKHCCPYCFFCSHSVALGLEFISRYSEFLKTHSNYSAEELADYLNGKEKPKSSDAQRATDKNYIGEHDYDLEDDYGEKEDDEYDSYEEEEQEEYGNEEQLSLFDDAEEIENKYKFYVIISRGDYGGGFSIRFYNNRGVPIIAEQTLKKAKLSPAQKKLFQWLNDYNPYSNADLEKLFLLIKDSGCKIYWDKKDNKNELKFAGKDNGDKLKAELRKKKNEWSGEDEFVFMIDKDYFKKKRFKFMRIKNGFIKLEDDTINFIHLPQTLSTLVANAY